MTRPCPCTAVTASSLPSPSFVHDVKFPTFVATVLILTLAIMNKHSLITIEPARPPSSTSRPAVPNSSSPDLADPAQP